MIENAWYVFNEIIIEYYVSWWSSIMYVFGIPVFIIAFWVDGWNLTDIIYDTDAYHLGLEWIQDSYIHNTSQIIKYHYMRWCINYPGSGSTNVFVKTLIFFGQWILDVLTLVSGLIGNTIFLPIGLYWILLEIII